MRRYHVTFKDASGIQRQASFNAKNIFILERLLTLFGCSTWTILGN